MKQIDADLFQPRTPMDSEFSTSTKARASGSDSDFGFAFNDQNFSDRILKLEIIPDLPESKIDGGDGCATLTEWARDRKRRREELKKDYEAAEATGENVELVQDLSIPQTEETLAYDNQDEEAVAMMEDCGADGVLHLGEQGEDSPRGIESGWSRDSSAVLRVNTIHISSPILAAKSPFFYKLFSNGMKESDQRHVTLRIHECEEAALMELVNFMYSGTLSTTTAPALLDVLMAADKFEVSSCMRYCSRLLRNLPMTSESAFLYLDLPSTVRMAEAVQPLTDAAKQYLAAQYKDISKLQEEVLNMPLAGIEAIFSSDDVQVASEDAVYDFLLKWARLHYTRLDERREIMGTRLAKLIRFPFMTSRKLKKVLTCNDLDHELASKVVLDTLFFKCETPYRQRALASEESNASSYRRLVERSYKYRPIKVVDFELPRPQCVVYLDFTREECSQLFPAGRVYSQAFHLGGQGFFLSGHCNMDQQSSFHCFGLFLGMQEKGSVSFAVDYEFAARTKPTDEFVSKYKGNYTFTGGKAVGYRNLFGVPWATFMADDSPFFINNILHLRAELTLKL